MSALQAHAPGSVRGPTLKAFMQQNKKQGLRPSPLLRLRASCSNSISSFHKLLLTEAHDKKELKERKLVEECFFFLVKSFVIHSFGA